jgi:hypothetical protein
VQVSVGGESGISLKKSVEKFVRLKSRSGRAFLDKRVNAVRIALERGSFAYHLADAA